MAVQGESRRFCAEGSGLSRGLVPIVCHFHGVSWTSSEHGAPLQRAGGVSGAQGSERALDGAEVFASLCRLRGKERFGSETFLQSGWASATSQAGGRARFLGAPPPFRGRPAGGALI